MLAEIKKELARIEDESEIKILLAVESGSRAWGFASADSDWDVRYIYIHKLDWYLKIDEQKDSLEEILPNELDLSGWELKKALKLFRKSNPPMLEWLRSPIIYTEQFSTAEKLREFSQTYFNPKSCMYHYLSMAKGNFKEFLQRDAVRLKKYFYVLRPVLACDWIKETNSFPPMEFKKLLDSQVKDAIIRCEIDELLKRKIAGDEMKEEPKIDILNEFLEEKINFYNDFVGEIEANEKPNTEMLDTLFKETIFEVWK
ncbi:MAG TPA: nucleotidyltransferase domain-containing protein [Pyrinomonadaceae bacterium]|nr:nucleotidyltransferase domain-containing protein [Pyrinomonadaceae bacterium]